MVYLNLACVFFREKCPISYLATLPPCYAGLKIIMRRLRSGLHPLWGCLKAPKASFQLTAISLSLSLRRDEGSASLNNNGWVLSVSGLNQQFSWKKGIFKVMGKKKHFLSGVLSFKDQKFFFSCISISFRAEKEIGEASWIFNYFILLLLQRIKKRRGGSGTAGSGGRRRRRKPFSSKILQAFLAAHPQSLQMLHSLRAQPTTHS